MSLDDKMQEKMQHLAGVAAVEIKKLFKDNPANMVVAATFMMELMTMITTVPIYKRLWMQLPDLMRIIANAIEVIHKEVRDEKIKKESNS